MVGLSCEGYEKDLMSLFAALERDREQSSLVTPRRKGGKLVRELKGLESSVNYDGKKISAKLGRSEGRAVLEFK